MPPHALPLPGPVRKIASSKGLGACALLQSGKIACFAAGYLPAPYYGPCSEYDCATRVLLSDVDDAVDIDIELEHGCIVRRDGSAMCWGDGSLGQLGSAAPVDFGTHGPAPVASPLSFASISVDLGTTCAVTLDGRVACWGLGTKGGTGVEECRPYDHCRRFPVLVPALEHVVQVVATEVVYDAPALALARLEDGSVVAIFDTKQGFELQTVAR